MNTASELGSGRVSNSSVVGERGYSLQWVYNAYGKVLLFIAIYFRTIKKGNAKLKKECGIIYWDNLLLIFWVIFKVFVLHTHIRIYVQWPSGPVCRDLCISVKHNKNQLCIYITTRPTWSARILVSHSWDPG